MAAQTLGRALLLPANTPTIVYTVPISQNTVLNLNIVNTGDVPVLVRVALSATATPQRAEWIEYDTYLGKAGTMANDNVLERTGLVAEGNVNLIVSANVAGVVAVRAFGMEK